MAIQVNISGTGDSFAVDDDESILDAATRSGICLPHECTFGGCGTCRIRLLEGAVRYEEFPMALTEQEHEDGYALACQARPLRDLVIAPARGDVQFAPAFTTTARVQAVSRLTDTITRLVLALPDDAALDYQPGQYMNIHLPGHGTRSFSMASALLPGNMVDFHIRNVPGGYFTGQYLAGLAAGDALTVELPLGTFCYHEQDWRPLVMVATGTGIAPIKAILESLFDQDDCPPVSLYWGMRTQADLYLKDEIESWRDRLCEFSFVPVLSRPDAGWAGRSGYVQDAVAADHEDLSEHALYMCGSPDMISQARRSFANRGANPTYIYTDSFTFQHPAAVAA